MKPGALLAFATFGLFICVAVNFWTDYASAEKVVTTTCFVKRDKEDCSRFESDGKTCDDMECKNGEICCMKDCNMTHFCLADPDIKSNP